MKGSYQFLQVILLTGSSLLLILALVVSVYFHQNLPSEDWPQVTGEVIGSQIQKKRVRATNGGWTNSFYARISYRYPLPETHPTQFATSSKIRFGGDFYSHQKGETRAYIRRFPTEGTVTVYLHPNDPRQSYLDPQVNAMVAGLPWCALGLSAIGFGLLIALRRAPDDSVEELREVADAINGR